MIKRIELFSPGDEVCRVDPVCPYFDTCPGCNYQDIPYTEELKLKEADLISLLQRELGLGTEHCAAIVASPKPYFYRNRIDLRLLHTRGNETLIGFTPENGHGVITIDQCAIAQEEINAAIPRIKEEAAAKRKEKHRLANVVLRSGQDGRVFWGGIGRRSCRLEERDYLWTDIRGCRIFYSLDTFFQANLSILPLLFDEILKLKIWCEATILYDLYGGVGLFSLALAQSCPKVYLIENCKNSVTVARYNVAYHKLAHVSVIEKTVEEGLPALLQQPEPGLRVAILDPPRAGLSPQALTQLTACTQINYLLYLSCNPQALTRDLAGFLKSGWKIDKIIPFDFFPKTRHLETLVLLVQN